MPPQSPSYTRNVMTRTTKPMRGSNGEKVRYLQDKNDKWFDAHQSSRDRMFESLGAFYDIAHGSWPTRERQELIEQGRHPTSFNIAQQKAQALAGSLYSEKLDADYYPLDDIETTLVRNIKHWYFKDKDDYDYQSVDRQVLLGGLLHASYCRIDVDYRKRRTGGIAFKYCQEGTVLEDPYWQTNDYHDWREAIEHFYMTPQEIIDFFETDDPYIHNAARVAAGAGNDYEPAGDIEVYRDMPVTWGSKELVIQYRWLERVRTTRLHMQMKNGEWIALPLKIDEEGVRAYLAHFGVPWQNVQEYPYEDNVLYLCTVCPNLSPNGILYEGKHDVQCGTIGIIPFWSYRCLGVNKGIFENFLDLQRTINYRESKKDDIIASMIANGGFVDVSALPGGKRDLETLKKNMSTPGYWHGVEGDPSKIVAPFPRNENQLNAIWNDLNTLIDMFDRISPVTPSLEGRAGGSEESGVLFEMKHAVTKMSTIMLHETWLQHQRWRAEAWYNQVPITYRGIYRAIKGEDGDLIEFNSPKYDELGNKYYANSVEDLPSANVVVSLKKSSPTERFARRTELFDLTKILSAHPDLFKNQIRILTNDFLDTLDRTPEERVKMKRLAFIEEIRDFTEVIAQIKTMEANGMNADVMKMQAQSMLSQMQNQMAQAQAAPTLSPAPPQIGQGGGGGQSGGPLPPSIPSPDRPEGSPGAPVQTFRGEFQP